MVAGAPVARSPRLTARRASLIVFGCFLTALTLAAGGESERHGLLAAVEAGEPLRVDPDRQRGSAECLDLVTPSMWVEDSTLPDAVAAAGGSLWAGIALRSEEAAWPRSDLSTS